MPRKILRPPEARARVARGRTAFEDNYRLHDAADPFIPGTRIPRLKPVAIGPRNIGYLEDEVDAVIDALAAMRDSRPPVVAHVFFKDSGPRRIEQRRVVRLTKPED